MLVPQYLRVLRNIAPRNYARSRETESKVRSADDRRISPPPTAGISEQLSLFSSCLMVFHTRRACPDNIHSHAYWWPFDGFTSHIFPLLSWSRIDLFFLFSCPLPLLASNCYSFFFFAFFHSYNHSNVYVFDLFELHWFTFSGWCYTCCRDWFWGVRSFWVYV